MQNQKQLSLVFTQYKKPPVFQESDIPQPKEGQVQIKIIGSTVNPSDRIRSYGGGGGYFLTPLPYIGGSQAYGQVVKVGEEKLNGLLGKKVSFFSNTGTWCEYAVTDSYKIWEMDADVPQHCAASGLVNPLTVLGFVDVFRKFDKNGQQGKGLIHTAAASALGRMLNRLCLKQDIPLLCIVRRKEQVEILQSEGAKYIINTSDQNWLQQYQKFIKQQGFNILFDALGGGQITQKLIENLPNKSEALIYGKLVAAQPLTIQNTFTLMRGVSVTGFLLPEWMSTLKMQEILKLKKELPSHLKDSLSTKLAKKIKLQDFPADWYASETNATQGKYFITP